MNVLDKLLNVSLSGGRNVVEILYRKMYKSCRSDDLALPRLLPHRPDILPLNEKLCMSLHKFHVKATAHQPAAHKGA